MAYKTSYTGAGMDEIFNKSKKFTVNDEVWQVISSEIETLDISHVLKPGNYIYSGKLTIPKMDKLYALNSNAFTGTTLNGSYMIFVQMINYNLYQYISSHGIIEANDDAIVIAWIRQSDFTYIPYIYWNNEPSNSMMTFAINNTNDVGSHKFNEQLRKFNSTGLQYYDSLSATYKDYISSGAMSTSIYGNVKDIFTTIDNNLSFVTNLTDHMNNSDIHVTADEKTEYSNKYTSSTAKTDLDTWQKTFLDTVQTKIDKLSNNITTGLSTIQSTQEELTTHANNKTMHPSDSQKTSWDSKADGDHTHTKDQITISTSDVIGVIDPSNIPSTAKEIQVTVTDETSLLALKKTQVHNGCWVLQKSDTSEYPLYYVVIDDTKLGSMDAFQLLHELPYSSDKFVWSNFKNKPTTLDELGLDVLPNSEVMKMTEEADNLSQQSDTAYKTALTKTSPLDQQDNSFSMENLIDLIDYKMQIIRSLISN